MRAGRGVPRMVLGCLLALGGCTRVVVPLEGRGCGQEGCLEGWVCFPLDGTCRPEITWACDGSGVCPDNVQAGDVCTAEGAFIPCHDGDATCTRGCRQCTDGAWTTCAGADCLLGQVASCATCEDDCSRLPHVRPGGAVCLEEAGAFRCGFDSISGCEPGWVDLTSAPGCETPCARTSPDTEICDGADNDCDGDVDPDGSPGCVPYFVDRDLDGYGGAVEVCACAQRSGLTSTGGDCDDDPAACGADCSPGLAEVCGDAFDQDCDPSSTACRVFHRDRDRDGYGHPTDTICECGPRDDYDIEPTGPLGDCDDGQGSVHPQALESCANLGTDNDCDGDAGELAPGQCTVFYRDQDRDGFGRAESACTCTGVAPFDAAVAGDCDDDPAACGAACYPGGPEVCGDGLNGDCADDASATMRDNAGCVLTITRHPGDPVEDPVSALAVTSSGTLWIGHPNGGLTRKVWNTAPNLANAAVAANGRVTVIALDDGEIPWIGYRDASECDSDDGGDNDTQCLLRRREGSSNHDYFTDDVLSRENNDVTALAHIGGGDMLVGTLNDVTFYDASDDRLECDTGSGHVRAAINDLQITARVWLGYPSQVSRCTPDVDDCALSCTAHDFFAGSDDVSSFALDLLGGIMWIGSNSGGITARNAVDASAPLFDVGEPPILNVTALGHYRNGTRVMLFAGTPRGLMVRDALGQWKVYTSAHGLLGDDVRAIAVDSMGRTVWVGTTTGLTELTVEP